MNKVTLREWVLFLTLFPTLAVGLVLTVFFSFERTSDLERDIESRAKIIAEAMSQSTSDAIETANFIGVNRLASIFHSNNSDFVRTIMVYDANNKSILSTSQRFSPRTFRYNQSELEEIENTIVQFESGYALYAPIELFRPSKDGMPTIQRFYGYVVILVSKQSIKNSQYSMMFTSLITLMLALMVCSLFARKMMRMISRPIRDMNQMVLHVREGILSARINRKYNGEIELLRVGINNMAQAIEDYQLDLEENIDQATIDLRETLERFEAQNVELDLQRRKAQEGSRVKSEFLANMSHELRTPLNGVIGFTKQILKTPLTDNQREFLTTIDGSANNLLSIINDILDFSKLDSGHMVIESIPFGFRSAIDELVTLLAPEAHNKNLEFSVHINQQLPNSLIGDEMRIKQVILNLLGNAIKFTDKGEVTIDIDFKLLENSRIEIHITVIDSGIGINENQQHSLFEAFGQADNSITRLYGGTGLGLIIAKHLAKGMQGDINFTSQPNHGSSFKFNFQCELNQLPIDDLTAPSDLENKTVLYFESHPHSRLATEDILKSWKMQVTTVATLNDLSQKQHLLKYDYALLGFSVTATNIDDIKGLIKTLKSSVAQVHIAINNSSLNLKETFLAAGAVSCISKPLTPTILAKYLSAKTKLLQRQLEPKQLQHKLPLKVLAVDDNEANLKLIATLLSEKVDNVVTVKNGKEAVLLCNKEKFSVIFMDLQMPIMDGVTAMKLIKEDSLNTNTDIVAVTAHAMQGEREKLIETGFNAYMAKPIDETMLTHLLFEHSDINELVNGKDPLQISVPEQTVAIKFDGIFDWQLALSRAGNRPELAAEMLTMLVESLAETKVQLQQGIKLNDLPNLSSIVHKLNGACCYNGVPKLEKIGQQIESNIKLSQRLADLEPELLELIDEIDRVIQYSDEYYKELRIQTLLN